ncbi:hypothetical protein NXS19_004616 [Fusarium pseudograminearum]|nr:hypothetical protein NXS19_004616 [Fusarium pseudograminearum]
MVQRSRTFVLPAELIKERNVIIYNDKIPTEVSDRAMFSHPVSIARHLSSGAFHAMTRAQPERYEALERAGFKVDPFGDIQDAVNIRLGGHYIDFRTSAKIEKKLINVKSDAIADRCTEFGLGFSDGTKINSSPRKPETVLESTTKAKFWELSSLFNNLDCGTWVVLLDMLGTILVLLLCLSKRM